MKTNDLSRSTVLASALLFAVGVILGVLVWLSADPARVTEVPRTAEWPQFIALSGLSAVATVIAVLRRGPGILLTPFRRRAAARLGLTMREGAIARRVAAGLLVLVDAYLLLRCGLQVTAGLDPDFTTNAWGGPSYLGAMYCHFLAGLLIATVSFGVLGRLLLHDESSVDAPVPVP